MELKFQARMILEILGKPKDYLKSSLVSLVNRLSEDKSLKVLEKTIHEPILVEGSNDLFTSFAELTVEFYDLDTYTNLIFSYMPSNIEIISPEEVNLSKNFINSLGNRLAARLHEYDAIAKKIVNEKDFLLTKLREIAPHLFKDYNSSTKNDQTNTREKVKNKNLSKSKKTRK